MGSPWEEVMARITVVDDYPAFVELMQSILTTLEGHQVSGLDSEGATLEQLINSQPDIVITDLRVSQDRVRGWSTLIMARTSDELRHIPVIICSADIETIRERADEFRQAGNILTLVKPFAMETLMAVLGEALALSTVRTA
jgi:CheY-like chemotaxis protein